MTTEARSQVRELTDKTDPTLLAERDHICITTMGDGLVYATTDDSIQFITQVGYRVRVATTGRNNLTGNPSRPGVFNIDRGPIDSRYRSPNDKGRDYSSMKKALVEEGLWLG